MAYSETSESSEVSVKSDPSDLSDRSDLSDKSDRSDFAVALSGSVRIFFVGCKCVFDSEMRRFQRASVKFS